MSENFQFWLEQQTKPRSLLLVDDSTDDCSLIQERTQQFNCAWLIAHDLSDATRYLAVKYPPEISLIFLDLKLGSYSQGIQAFRTLKKEYPKVPIVILSGALTTAAIDEITAHGFALFAQKPRCFDSPFFEELFAILNIPLRAQIRT